MLLVPAITSVLCHGLLIILLSETCSEMLLYHTTLSFFVSSNKIADLSESTHFYSFELIRLINEVLYPLMCHQNQLIITHLRNAFLKASGVA